ncbi:zf-DHHC-domain-containing protein, partial [Metschnikowia bicuspidata var. bicuspidata NRRL YB-4993]
AFLVAVLVFGDSPALRNTPLHRLHRVLVRAGARLGRAATARPAVYAALRWTVPVFYAATVGVCVAQFFAHVYVRLGVRHSRGHALYMAVSLAALAAATALLTFSDPGVVLASTVARARRAYADNGLIFFAGRVCRTCGLPKVARSKHCSTCGRCVYVHDHHCIFANNCVGQNNYRWFVAFLLANINVMVYGGAVSWAQVRGAAAPGAWWWWWAAAPGAWWAAVTGPVDAARVAALLLALALVFAVVLAAFAGLHVRYMYLGVTTNEADKWGDIEHLVALGALYHAPGRGVFVERAEAPGAGGAVFILLADQRVLFAEHPAAPAVRRVLLVADVPNVYDRGFAANVRDRL